MERVTSLTGPGMAENLILTKIDGRFVQVGHSAADYRALAFFIRSGGGEESGPFSFFECRWRLTGLAGNDQRYDVIERLP